LDRPGFRFERSYIERRMQCKPASDNEKEAIMSVEQAILEAVRALPAEKQRELLRHANRLRQETRPASPFRSIKGLWSDLGISLSAEEIEENQREMWKNFPREESPNPPG
jgi:hypothetical protein